MEKYLIYKYTSPSGKSYIGQTLNLRNREYVHQTSKGCRLFSRAILKYGWDKMKLEILLTDLTLDQANTYEELFICEHNTLAPKGYNLTTGGLNYKNSEETKQLKRQARLGTKLSIETKIKIGLKSKGRIPSIETNLKRSLAAKNRVNNAKNTIWITDGIKNKRIPKNIPIECGWYQGRTK